MIWKNPPEQAFSDLRDVIYHTYRLTERALATVQARQESERKNFSVYYYSHSVRFEIRTALEADAIFYGYTVKDLPNDGIEISHKGYKIKLLKGRGGHPPPAGRSKQRRAFYQQSLFGVEYELDLTKNLVLIWSVNNRGAFLGLELCCPKQSFDDYESPLLHWSMTVPHPATEQEPVEFDEYISDDSDDLSEIRRQDDDDFDEWDIFKQGTDDE
ncbi:MAG TPA: hypothetical protein VF644_15330 [Pyrinomonadaceae bacterium]|jgi:hypothetical protein